MSKPKYKFIVTLELPDDMTARFACHHIKEAVAFWGSEHATKVNYQSITVEQLLSDIDPNPVSHPV